MDFSYTSNAANSILGGNKGGGFFPNLRAKQREQGNISINNIYSGSNVINNNIAGTSSLTGGVVNVGN